MKEIISFTVSSKIIKYKIREKKCEIYIMKNTKY